MFLTKNEATLRIVKLKLESEGIPTMIFDQRDSMYTPFGDISLEVLVEDREKALAIIEEIKE